MKEAFRSGEDKVAARHGLDREHCDLVTRPVHRGAVEVNNAVSATTCDGQIGKTLNVIVADVDEILRAVRVVAAGGTAFSSQALDAARSTPRAPSDREISVLRSLAGGASSDEIGALLGISTRTVESHLRRMFDRYGVVSRTELAVLALREGWVEVRGT